MIDKFKKFKDNLLLDNINESFLYFIKDFRDNLKSLSSKKNLIAIDLLDQERKDVKPDMTFIGLSDKEEYLNFTQIKKVTKIVKDNILDRLDDVDKIINNIDSGDVSDENIDLIYDTYNLDKKSRSEIRLGKLVNKIFPGKYNDKDVEEFVNLFKSINVSECVSFELVKGDDIEKYYDSNIYLNQDGVLGNSCMKYKKVFELYTKNVDVCSMLILLEDGLLIGRSIIWKVNYIGGSDVKFEYFMDRIYTSKDSDVNKFKEYAFDKGWAHKSYNSYDRFDEIHYDETPYSGIEMRIKVIPGSYNNYPFMDTFRRYSNIGYLYNDSDEDCFGDYILNDTDGSYEIIEASVWSERYEQYIIKSDAVWSDPYQDWIVRSSSISLNGDIYDEDDDNIIYCFFDEEYYHVDDCLYSDSYQSFINQNNLVNGIVDFDFSIDTESFSMDTSYLHIDDRDYVTIDKNMTWYKVLLGKDISNSGNEIDIDDCSLIGNAKHSFYGVTSEEEGGYFPKIIEVNLYLILEPKEGCLFNTLNDGDGFYLSKDDAEIIGWTLNDKDNQVIDLFEYHYNLNKRKLKDNISTSILDLIVDEIINDDDKSDRLSLCWLFMPDVYKELVLERS